MLKGDELSESAKAVKEGAKAIQEVAKTANTALESSNNFVSWFGRLISSPAQEVSGILTDHLQFKRWERRVRLQNRVDELLAEREVPADKQIGVSAKIALPALESASLEDDDELQDIWARLLASAADPNAQTIHPSYIGVIRQLDRLDAQMLDSIASLDDARKQPIGVDCSSSFLGHFVLIPKPRKALEFETVLPSDFQHSIENLERLGCIEIEFEGNLRWNGYSSFHLSAFGRMFWKACIKP